ncbi:MAG: hypothetical protein ACLPXZ_26065 [Mycobacterium sp.]
MKLALNLTKRRGEDERRRAPSKLFGGRIRTSTVVLIIAFFAVSWVYGSYRTDNQPAKPPPAQVVPPGFVPDPNYTWVPRTRVDQRPSTTVPQTPTTTETPTPTTTTTSPPPFTLPTLPCLIPALCPSSTTAPSAPSSPVQQPPPGPGPVPTSAPAAG